MTNKIVSLVISAVLPLFLIVLGYFIGMDLESRNAVSSFMTIMFFTGLVLTGIAIGVQKLPIKSSLIMGFSRLPGILTATLAVSVASNGLPDGPGAKDVALIFVTMSAMFPLLVQIMHAMDKKMLENC